MRLLFWSLAVSFAWYNGILIFRGETPSTDSYLYGLAFVWGPCVALVLASSVGAPRVLIQASIGMGVFLMLVLTVLSVTNRIAFVGPILLAIFAVYSTMLLLYALLARGVRSMLKRFKWPQRPPSC